MKFIVGLPPVVHPEKRLITTQLPTDFSTSRGISRTRVFRIFVLVAHVFISLFIFPDCHHIDLCKTRGIGLTAEPSNLREGGYETELL
jgi:hypothetical protein